MLYFANPKPENLRHKKEIMRAVEDVLDSGSYMLGPQTEKLEQQFADYIGVKHAAALNSGTDALYLALKALDIGQRDEVITVSFTALATASAIIKTGATPVFVDIDADYYTLDPTQLAQAITPKTKAIIPVHIYGQAADMDAIVAIANEHNIPVIEDCAQAAGATYKDQRAGSIGAMACFSFYPTKNLGALGDAGMVVTNNAAHADKIRRLHQYGWDKNRTTAYPGINSRMDEIQAAILNIKLGHLDAENKKRQAIAAKYSAAFADLPMTLPKIRDDAAHVFHLYVIASKDKTALMQHLKTRDIQAGVHYPQACHQHGGYDALCSFEIESLKTTCAILDEILTLPLYPDLSDKDVEHVITAVKDFYN